MANKDAAFGFRPVRHLTGGEIRTNEYKIAANYDSNIFTGQPVLAVTAGGIEVADDSSGTQYPTIQEGKYKGVIGVGGLLLARIPVEIVEERMDYFAQQTQDKETAINNDLLKEEHPSMPISKPDRQSRVTFGGNRKD